MNQLPANNNQQQPAFGHQQPAFVSQQAGFVNQHQGDLKTIFPQTKFRIFGALNIVLGCGMFISTVGFNVIMPGAWFLYLGYVAIIHLWIYGVTMISNSNKKIN